MVNALQREEQIRDLKRQIEGLGNEDEEEVVFRDVSKRHRETLYRVIDGEPVPLPRNLARAVIHRFGPNGQPLWTTNPENAAKWVPGTVKCFLHPDSPEAQSGLLAELGLAPVCTQGGLRNAQAKKEHAEHTHKREWASLQDYLGEQREQNWRDQQTAQTEATLELARAAAGQRPRIKSTPANEPTTSVSLPAATLSRETCDCGWVTPEGKNPAKSLAFHKRLHCPLKGNADG